jgi:spore germination protein GerM
VDKNKKNIDYWDKYYGSGKDKKERYPDYDKKYSSKTIKENTSGNKASRRDPESEGRIIGSEYKIKNAAKKRRKSPALRFTILIIIIFFAGFFTFYAIDNHLFSGGKVTESTNSVLSSGSSDAASTSSDGNGSVLSATQSANTSVQESSSSSTEVSGESQAQNASGSSQQSIWQALILFFKNFGKSKSEIADYPKKIVLNVYFAVLGSDKVFGSEERSIVAGSPKIAATSAINELLKGPYEDFNFAVIPAGTRLIDVELTDKIVKVNFSQEFLSEGLDSSILDDYIIYTVVNTLTEIPDIEAVSFSIDGKDVKVYGNVDLQLPLIRNEKYLENKK